MDNPISSDIHSLMGRVSTLKANPAMDKKVLNKVNARLEEAWLWSKQLDGGTQRIQAAGQAITAECTCIPGSVDKTCVQHGNAV